ncbi:MAG: cupin domain-containing protein [Deltaproteobacteria bacterium]|nr:cupin domain-containing protein [Deltaproteobacteria bacterium]
MNVAKRIRRMREAQDLTVVQVAELTGLSADYLRAVELGEEVPSIGAVIKISRALGSKMGQILHAQGARPEIFSLCPAGEAQPVVRAPAGAKQGGQGYTYRSLLSPDIRGQGMEPFLVRFDPEAASTVEPIAHEGEEFLYVLSGTLELLYDGKTHTLKSGDSLYLDSSRPHALRATGDTPPQVVAVVYSKG